MFADGIDYFKLSLEIALCNRPVQTTGTTYPSDVTELNVTQWLTKCGLLYMTQYCNSYLPFVLSFNSQFFFLLQAAGEVI